MGIGKKREIKGHCEKCSRFQEQRREFWVFLVLGEKSK
jgi:hypothetical protein